MSKRRTVRRGGVRVAIVGAALLAGCGDEAEAPGNTRAAGTPGNGAPSTNGATSANSMAEVAYPPPTPIVAVRARLQEMAGPERNAVFMRAIRDARQPCQNVQNSGYAGQGPTGDLWTATCEDGAVYTVVVAGDGNATVTPGAPGGAGSTGRR